MHVLKCMTLGPGEPNFPLGTRRPPGADCQGFASYLSRAGVHVTHENLRRILTAATCSRGKKKWWGLRSGGSGERAKAAFGTDPSEPLERGAEPALPGWGSGPIPPNPSSGGPSLPEPTHTAGIRFPINSGVMAPPDRARLPKLGRGGNCGTPGDGAQATTPGPAYNPKAGTPKCAEHQRVRPDHDRFHATRAGEASNPGPAILPPWDPDPEYTSRFGVFGKGWVALVFEKPLAHIEAELYAFRIKGPLGGRFATFNVVKEAHLFRGLIKVEAYVCADAKPVQPHWEGAHEFLAGQPGSTTVVVPVQMAPSGLAWKTEEPRSKGEPWTNADLACGIRGLTVAAQRLGASTTWACDVNLTAIQAYNAAHNHTRSKPTICYPIELRTHWAKHVGTDLISADFLCQAFSKVGKRQSYRDARKQIIFHLIQTCWVPRPCFMVLECGWPFFENPHWLEPV